MEILEKLVMKIKEIDAALAGLQEERESLREEVIGILQQQNQRLCYVDCGEAKYVLSRMTSVRVTYDEALLKSRLGDKYKTILKPDYRKFKKHLAEVQGYLLPVIEKIGAVSKDLVKEQVAKGALNKADFTGAFNKEEKDILYIKNDAGREPDAGKKGGANTQETNPS